MGRAFLLNCLDSAKFTCNIFVLNAASYQYSFRNTAPGWRQDQSRIDICLSFLHPTELAYYESTTFTWYILYTILMFAIPRHWLYKAPVLIKILSSHISNSQYCYITCPSGLKTPLSIIPWICASPTHIWMSLTLNTKGMRLSGENRSSSPSHVINDTKPMCI